MSSAGHENIFEAKDYHLPATLNSGQAFRWTRNGDDWEGVVHGHWVRLRQQGGRIIACTAVPQADWRWLANYLQVGVNLDPILAAFPQDETMRAAVEHCRGLRLLRQDPWECLASFILSSTKQIVQIRQIVATLCVRWGAPVPTLPGAPAAHAFPSAETLAQVSEAELRLCKAGFRAPYLLATARKVAAGGIDLNELRNLPMAEAREELIQLPGVGGKIADCVLLFACGFPTAFPVDVWMLKVLRQFYFKRRRLTPARLRELAAAHFGPQAGYAQQYLFHWIRHQKELCA